MKIHKQLYLKNEKSKNNKERKQADVYRVEDEYICSKKFYM